jgi:hypothetical protein
MRPPNKSLHATRGHGGAAPANTAANAGDYIYPADVRFDDTAGLLYVKAGGHRAAFGEAQTWLFEYDLRRRKQRDRTLVDPDVLPRECPETR